MDTTYKPLGIACLAVGAAAIWIATDYAYGTVTAMGPGFIPTAVALLLMLLGLLILVVRGSDVEASDKAAAEPGGEMQTPRAELLSALRSVGCISAAIIVFGLGVKDLGLGITLFLVVLLAGLAHPAFRWGPLIALAFGLSVAACAGFVTLLGLQIPIWPRFG